MKRFSCTDPDFIAKFSSALADSSHDPEVEKVVREIVDEVRRNGDSALIELTARFDGPLLSTEQLRVSPDEIASAVAALDPLNREAIEESITNVSHFHSHCRPENWLITNPHGGQVGERYYPLRRVGLYVPGGQVPLVSTVIMIATLAQAAGVPEIAVSTPPQTDGSIAPELLAALSLCQVDEIYKVGGAQAIAAFAHGTETIGAVDKIFGPGNAYVNEAKRHVFGIVGIDLLPGPSEVMVIADETANPSYVAAALLAQAEHGSGKEHVFLASDSSSVIEQALVELERQIKTLSHRTVIRKTLESGLYVIETDNEKSMVEVANLIAPEHLELQVKESKIEGLTAAITTAGAIMQGHDTPTVLGDFAAGPSHVLPTGRASRFSSGLRLSDFLRRSSIIRYDQDALRQADSIIKRFASMENLDGHGHSLSVRLTESEP
jgi:histidinol dehydrogenase